MKLTVMCDNHKFITDVIKLVKEGVYNAPSSDCNELS